MIDDRDLEPNSAKIMKMKSLFSSCSNFNILPNTFSLTIVFDIRMIMLIK